MGQEEDNRRLKQGSQEPVVRENWYLKVVPRMDPTGCGLCKSVLELFLDKHAPQSKLEFWVSGHRRIS